MDPYKRKRFIRNKFRGLVRAVMGNRYWMIEAEERKVELRNDRNMAVIIRRTRNRSVLTLADRVLVNKPHNQRTPEEVKQLETLFFSLQSFDQFPRQMVIDLIPHVIYSYFNSGRMILREGAHARGVYFILAGEVVQTKKVWNTITKKYVEEDVSVFGSGDYFGHFGVIFNKPRHLTTYSATEVELLIVDETDFHSKLKEEIQEKINQKMSIFNYFSYLKRYDSDQLYTCCQISKITAFARLEAICWEDGGIIDPVQFLLSGECMIIQCLRMKVRYANRKKIYTLLKEEQEKTDDQKMGARKSLFKLYHDKQIATKKEKQKMKIPEEDILDEFYSFMNEEFQLSEDTENIESLSTNFIESQNYLSGEKSQSSAFNKSNKDEIEYHFLDVGSLSKGAIFGLGENMVDRAIVAKSPVVCLQIPRHWLLETAQNRGSYWTKLRYSLDLTIPSREKLFQDFLRSIKWKNDAHNLLYGHKGH